MRASKPAISRAFLPAVPSVVKTSQAAMLLILLLSATHFLAWIYRSVILPLVDQGGVIGGGSQMFAHIQETGSVFGMIGFLVLALIVGPGTGSVLMFTSFLKVAVLD
jgi:hypothetical protein